MNQPGTAAIRRARPQPIEPDRQQAIDPRAQPLAHDSRGWGRYFRAIFYVPLASQLRPQALKVDRDSDATRRYALPDRAAESRQTAWSPARLHGRLLSKSAVHDASEILRPRFSHSAGRRKKCPSDQSRYALRLRLFGFAREQWPDARARGRRPCNTLFTRPTLKPLTERGYRIGWRPPQDPLDGSPAFSSGRAS